MPDPNQANNLHPPTHRRYQKKAIKDTNTIQAILGTPALTVRAILLSIYPKATQDVKDLVEDRLGKFSYHGGRPEEQLPKAKPLIPPGSGKAILTFSSDDSGEQGAKGDSEKEGTHEVPDSTKSTWQGFKICTHCKEPYDPEDGADRCWFHPGLLDLNRFAPLWRSAIIIEPEDFSDTDLFTTYLSGFTWRCCGKIGDSLGCRWFWHDWKVEDPWGVGDKRKGNEKNGESGGRDGKDGKGEKVEEVGRNGKSGTDGENGKDGRSGQDKSNGEDERNGNDETDGGNEKGENGEKDDRDQTDKTNESDHKNGSDQKNGSDKKDETNTRHKSDQLEPSK